MSRIGDTSSPFVTTVGKVHVSDLSITKVRVLCVANAVCNCADQFVAYIRLNAIENGISGRSKQREGIGRPEFDDGPARHEHRSGHMCLLVISSQLQELCVGRSVAFRASQWAGDVKPVRHL
jgi:hypothetical protein